MIALARHGETDENVEGRFQGQGPVPLNATGRRQARELATQAAREPWASLHASPIPRARETAEIVAAAIGIAPVFDRRLAETDTGDWTGRLFAEVQRDEPELWAAWQAGGAWRFPGGEALAEQQARVVEALDELRTRADALPALVVCHRGVIRVALCHERGRPLEAFQTIAVPNGSLVRL